MCTSIVSNIGKTVVGWNLDILDMEYRVRPTSDGVYIEINDKTEGWMPLFGANRRGEFVSMPCCWPYDSRSDMKDGGMCIINLDIDLLLMKKTFAEVREIAESGEICSIPGTTFQAQLSDADGNVLQIVPGQGYRYIEKPRYSIMTNFSPFKMNSETHPWMGWDRYQTVCEMIKKYDSFGVGDCFAVLKAASQTVCPTVVSMVFDVGEKIVYWCEQREYDKIKKYTFD